MNFKDNYYPLQYTSKVKKAKKYLLQVILGDDFLVVLFAFSFTANNPILQGLGLFFMLVSFWCIYEIGYIENDLVGAKFEDNPILNSKYQLYEQQAKSFQPWLYAIIFAILGTLILVFSRDRTWQFVLANLEPMLSKLLCWLTFLCLVRFLFYIYNHVNKQTRIWFYLILQTCRYFGFLILIQTTTIGAVFLIAHTIARFIPYILYRYLGGKSGNWPKQFPLYFFRFLFYIFLLLGLVVGSPDLPLSLLLAKQTLLIALFCLARGSLHFWRVIFHCKPVWKDSSNRVV